MFNVDRVFTYHSPSGTQPTRYAQIREQAKAFAKLIQASTPESREQSLALTYLQQSVMFANAAIAINENPVETPSAPKKAEVWLDLMTPHVGLYPQDAPIGSKERPFHSMEDAAVAIGRRIEWFHYRGSILRGEYEA